MYKYDQLLSYIPYFESSKFVPAYNVEGLCKIREMGVDYDPTKIYDQEMLDFATDFSNSNFKDFDYVATLESLGYCFESTFGIDIEETGYIVLRALLSSYIFLDSEIPGSWIFLLRNKGFLRILKRMAKIQGEDIFKKG
jgi:hypothetical protein